MERHEADEKEGPQLEPMIRSGDAARLLGVCPATLKAWAKAGLLPKPVRVNARVQLYPVSAIRRILAEGARDE